MPSKVELDITNCLESEHRLVLLNLLHDDRISHARKAQVDTLLASTGPGLTVPPVEPAAAAQLRRVIHKYKRQRITIPGVPDYISPVLNGNNFVPFAKPSGKKGIHPDTLLVHVIDLSKYVKAKGYSSLPGCPGTGAHQVEIIAWLGSYVPAFPDTDVSGRSETEVDEFVERTLEAIHDYESAPRSEPVWVALWDQFRQYVHHGLSMWMKMLGMRDSVSRHPRYPLVLVYRADSVGTLVRPTQLEAGFDAFHFPSPPSAPPTAGGYTMDWSAMPGYREPLREFLHQRKPDRDNAADWILGGRLSGPTTPGGAPLKLNETRRRHYGRLKSIHGPLPGGWMRDVTCLA